MFIRFLFENSGFKSLAARRKELKSWGRIISDGYNHVIKLLICFQLIFYPITSSAQNIPEEQYRQTQLDTVEAYNQKIDSLFEHIFGPRSSTQFYTNHPLDFYSLIGQNVIMKETSSKKPKETKKPFFTHINPDRLLVEIISIDGAGEEKVEAILNSSGNSIKNKIPQEAKDLYTGVQYSIQNKELLHSFKLSYQGQILHNFSNHIQWIAIFGPYLVFMEGAQIYEQRAMLSFIDLNYFRTAIGKTALPIFRIPMAIESLNKAEILTPQITDNELSIGQNKNHKITRKELDAFTHIQHVIFSVLVSLLSIDRYERDMIPFFKDISNEIERLLQNQRATRVQNLEATERPSGFVESHHVVEKIISEIIKSRVDLGSPSHQTGHYGQVKAAQHRLEPLELNELDNEAYQKSLAHLEADQKFQNHIKEVYRQKLEERKIKERVKGLVAQLLVPQPLGALKIQKSLGLIANSVRKGGSIEDRVMALEKKIIALEQENKSVRSRTFTRSRILIALPVLAGAAGLASQEGALFYEYIFRYVGETLFAFGNVLFENGKQALSSLNIPQAYRTYLSDGKGFSFAVGTLSVISTMFALFITLQVMVNLRHFLRYLKTQRAYEHEVTASVHRKKILDHFKSFISETRQAYAENLARGEFKKLGISAVFRFSDDTKVEVAFRTFERFSSVLEDYTNKNFNIDLILSTKNSVEKLQLSSVPEDSSREDKVTLEFLVGEQEKAIRTFVLKEGTLRDIFNNNLIKENVSIEIHSENENRQTVSLYRGDLISRHFTSEEIEQLNTALLDIEKEKINKKKERALDRLLIRIQTGAEQTVEEHNSLAEKTSLLSDKEIKSTAQAMRIFLFDFSTLVNTEYFKVTLWSYFAMFRQFLTFPRSFGTLALFSNYFNRVYTESHVPTFFNGGYQIRFIESIKKIFPSGREYLSSLKDFETKMIPIERQYIRAATEYTYLVALKRFMIGEDSLDSLIAAGVQKHENKKSEFLPKDDITDRSNFSLDDAGKKAAFLEFFQTVLFEESMRDYLREVLAIEEGQKMTDRNILSVLKNKLKQGESLHLPRESLNDVRDRVKKMANEHNLEQDTNNTMDRFYRAFFKKYSIKRKKQMQNLLSPNTNSFMQRIYVVDSMSKDPEAMSRITRSEFTKLLIDKPIELAILLLLMSGATDGILKVLHAEPFGEQSVFYFSTYIIWAVFMVKFVLEFFADSWLKIQVDANRGLREDVENFLKKEDIEKRFAALKWFWKSSKEKGNEYMEYYKFLWKVVHSNIRPAIVLMGMAFVSTMGRFDIELLIGVLLVEALLGVGALKYKMDGSYEKFKSYALKDLIKRNIDVKKFLTHPFVQQIFIDESFKYRLKFNFWNALLVNNPLENISRLVESSGALSGSRAFYRAFTPSHNSITGGYLDRAVELASQAEDHLINFCKKAFTRNRMDTFD